MQGASTPTLLFQAPNRYGLGHVSRLSAIALALRKRLPAAKSLFVLEGADTSLIEAVGFPYVVIPEHSDLASDRWQPWSNSEKERLGDNLASELVRSLAPDLAIVDTHPNPSFLVAARRNRVPLVICVRKRKAMDSVLADLAYLEHHFSMILLPHEKGEMDIPKVLESKVRFVGQIVRPPPANHPKLDEFGNPAIIISGGGGGFEDVVRFYNAALEAFAIARRQNPGLNGVLVTGPMFRDWWNLKLVEGIRVVPFDPNLIDTFAAANLVICQAGYNTIAEVTSLGVKTICVPGERVFDDQFERAEKAAAANPAFRYCKVADAQEIAHQMEDLLALPAASKRVNDTPSSGADRAANAIIELLASVPRRTPLPLPDQRGCILP